MNSMKNFYKQKLYKSLLENISLSQNTPLIGSGGSEQVFGPNDPFNPNEPWSPMYRYPPEYYGPYTEPHPSEYRRPYPSAIPSPQLHQWHRDPENENRGWQDLGNGYGREFTWQSPPGRWVPGPIVRTPEPSSEGYPPGYKPDAGNWSFPGMPDLGPGGMYYIDPNGHVYFLNPETGEVYVWSPGYVTPDGLVVPPTMRQRNPGHRQFRLPDGGTWRRIPNYTPGTPLSLPNWLPYIPQPGHPNYNQPAPGSWYYPQYPVNPNRLPNPINPDPSDPNPYHQGHPYHQGFPESVPNMPRPTGRGIRFPNPFR